MGRLRAWWQLFTAGLQWRLDHRCGTHEIRIVKEAPGLVRVQVNARRRWQWWRWDGLTSTPAIPEATAGREIDRALMDYRASRETLRIRFWGAAMVRDYTWFKRVSKGAPHARKNP